MFSHLCRCAPCCPPSPKTTIPHPCVAPTTTTTHVDEIPLAHRVPGTCGRPQCPHTCVAVFHDGRCRPVFICLERLYVASTLLQGNTAQRGTAHHETNPIATSQVKLCKLCVPAVVFGLEDARALLTLCPLLPSRGKAVSAAWVTAARTSALQAHTDKTKTTNPTTATQARCEVT